MKYRPIGAELFKLNRKNFVEQLKPKSVAVFHSNDIMPTNADGTMPFKQNSNLLYLSGIDQEETVLIIAPDFPDPNMREILFVKETSEEIAIWEGHKFTKPEATDISGVKNVKWLTEFENTLSMILAESDHIYIDLNEHIRSANEVETRTERFFKWCKHHFPLHNYERSFPLLMNLRMVKSKREVDMIQHACDITEKGFRRILDAVNPGVWEYEIEAEYMHEFLMNRSRGFAYTPIVASGANACVLHYIENNQQCKDGDLILMDVGAEYANYNADMTRTIPVGGRFNTRQLDIYNAVLRVKTKATELLRPGTTITAYHKEVGLMMETELLELGLIDKTDVKNQDPSWPAYKKYFMHGTSHHLGLDVHDVGSFHSELKAGNVFTVEPGIYIREEGIGIRLEDNILITEDGHLNLMRNIPIHAEEIEDLMNK